MSDRMAELTSDDRRGSYKTRRFAAHFSTETTSIATAQYVDNLRCIELVLGECDEQCALSSRYSLAKPSK